MAFLANKTVNLLYVNYGLLALAQGGGGVFFAVFLLKAACRSRPCSAPMR